MKKEDIKNHLKESFGLEEADAEELFVSYAETVFENSDKFEPLLRDGKYDDLTRAAHSIKGCALNCGDEEMAAAAKAVEFASKEKRDSDIVKYSADLKALAKNLK